MIKNLKNAVVFDLGGHNLRVALIDQSYRIIEKSAQSTVDGRNLLDVVSQIRSMYMDLVGDAKIPVSLCVPGYVRKNQVIACAPNFPNWIDVNIIGLISEALNIPQAYCMALNDANAAMLAEKKMGHAQKIKNCIYIGIGTGLGGAILSDDKLLLGDDNIAGEIGHMSIQMDGPRCTCGNLGCIERYISASALESQYNKSLKAIADDARSGDQESQTIYNDLGKHLGVALASLIHLFNPQRILLGGRVSRSKDLFEQAMNIELKHRLESHPGHAADIMLAKLGDDAGMVGAAVAYFENQAHVQH